MLIDIVSDLHIDQWDKTLRQDNPLGSRINDPLDWHKVRNHDSKILVVAGDASDSIDMTIEYMNHVSSFYEHVLLVDGNHEHSEHYPQLLSEQCIHDKIIANNNSKLKYLPHSPVIIDGTAFIGEATPPCCHNCNIKHTASSTGNYEI